jgi:hypothetical protein
MKSKIFTFVLCLLFIFNLVAKAYAADVTVVGRLEGKIDVTIGGNVVFKNSSSGEIASSVPIDPGGLYSVSVPQGTYDISFIPPKGSGFSEKTESNIKVDSNTIKNIEIPSVQNSQETSYLSGIFGTVGVYASVMLAAIIICIGAVYIFLRRK